MSTQDRNIERSAEVARKYIQKLLNDPQVVNEEEVQLLFAPRHNFRLIDLALSSDTIATAVGTLRACIATELSAIGAPQFTAAAAVTFLIEAFPQLDAGIVANNGATAAQAFSGAFTVSDGFWGVVTVQVDGSQVITTKHASGVMAFLTEEEAILNAPKPDALNGLVGVLTIEASGADFIGATDNTSTANAFNTVDRGGLLLPLVITGPTTQFQADLDLAANRRLRVAGVGNLIGTEGDMLALAVKSAGALGFTNAMATLGYRKFPLQGESGPDVATGLTAPQVV